MSHKNKHVISVCRDKVYGYRWLGGIESVSLCAFGYELVVIKRMSTDWKFGIVKTTHGRNFRFGRIVVFLWHDSWETRRVA